MALFIDVYDLNFPLILRVNLTQKIYFVMKISVAVVVSTLHNHYDRFLDRTGHRRYIDPWAIAYNTCSSEKC